MCDNPRSDPVRFSFRFSELHSVHAFSRQKRAATSCRRRVKNLKATVTFDCSLSPLPNSHPQRRRSLMAPSTTVADLPPSSTTDSFNSSAAAEENDIRVSTLFISLKFRAHTQFFFWFWYVSRLFFFSYGSHFLSSTRLRLGANQPRRWKPSGGSSRLLLNSLRGLRSKARERRKAAIFSRRYALKFSRLFGRKSIIQSKWVCL